MTEEEYNSEKRKLELKILRKQIAVKDQELLKLKRESSAKGKVLTPISATIIVALVGVFGTLTANLIQRSTAMKIEKQKSEFQIYAKAQESQDPEKAARILDFYISMGLIDGEKGQFSRAVKEGDTLNSPPVFDEHSKTLEEVYSAAVLSTIPKESKGEWRIENNYLLGNGVIHQLVPKTSGEFKSGYPDAIILHFTASANMNATLHAFKSSAINGSDHFVVDKNGQIVQLIPLNYTAHGAGISNFDGRTGWNNYSIQISMVNRGRLTKRDDKFYDVYNHEFPTDSVVTARHQYESEISYWAAYTPEQVEAVKKLCSLLVKEYEIKYILGHDDISRPRKQCPGPAFPMKAIQSLLNNETP